MRHTLRLCRQDVGSGYVVWDDGGMVAEGCGVCQCGGCCGFGRDG